mgnify:CR=1 FL=1
MSRTYKDRGYRRKAVRNSFLQKILMRYGDDFGGNRKKDKMLSRTIRKRLKIEAKREMEKYE